MRILKSSLTLAAMALQLLSFGQFSDYTYKSPISGVKDQWHVLELTDDVMQEVKSDLSDFRVYVVQATGDTFEMPFFIREKRMKYILDDVDFKLMNESSNSQGTYFTIVNVDKRPINDIALNLENQNFDWRLNLEGSHDQKTWFTVLEDYRILDVSSNNMDYNFTNLKFRPVDYAYLRVQIKDTSKAKIIGTKVRRIVMEDGHYKTFTQLPFKQEEDKEKSTSIIDFQLPYDAPICNLKVNVGGGYDYNRTMSISYLSDSTVSEVDTKYHYREIGRYNLTTLDTNFFRFEKTKCKKVRLTIFNYDNEPLDITELEAKAPVHEAIIRFTKEGRIWAVFGNEGVSFPSYDITSFKDSVPQTLSPLRLGKFFTVKIEEGPETKPLFENSVWLWIIMGVLILLLAWFSVKMLRNS